MRVIELAKEAGLVDERCWLNKYADIAHFERFAALVRAEALAEPVCEHRITDARNEFVKDGYICIKCGALFRAADHAEPVKQEPAAWWDGTKNFVPFSSAPVQPVKQEPVACIALALEALIYHTQQTRPIQKTDEAIIYLQNVLNKQEKNMTFTLEDAIKKFPEIAYWHSEFEKHNTITAPVQPVQEPVVCPVCCNGYLVKYIEEYCNSCGTLCQSPKTIRENSAPIAAKAIRAEALEEAEEIAKTIGGSFAEEFLAAIRRLK